MPLRLFTLGLLLLTGASAGAADLLARGATLQQQGKHREALALFQRASKAGDAVGDYGLGVLYFQGEGVRKDIAASTRHFRAAAKKAYAPAAYNLGNAYLRGHGVKPDIKQAEYWWRRAARQGYARAQFNMGALLYENGSQALREEGIAWYRAAAMQGFDEAREHLRQLEEPLMIDDLEWDPRREPQRSEGRLMTLPPANYTVQLFSSTGTEGAKKFIARHKLQEAAAVFRFSKNGKAWTGVVFGVYSNRGEAAETIDALKPALKRSGPWPRKISDIQAKIETVRKLADR